MQVIGTDNKYVNFRFVTPRKSGFVLKIGWMPKTAKSPLTVVTQRKRKRERESLEVNALSAFLLLDNRYITNAKVLNLLLTLKNPPLQ